MSSLLLSFVLYSQKLQLVAESELLRKRIDELRSVTNPEDSGVEKVRSSSFPPSRHNSLDPLMKRLEEDQKVVKVTSMVIRSHSFFLHSFLPSSFLSHSLSCYGASFIPLKNLITPLKNLMHKIILCLISLSSLISYDLGYCTL